MENCLSNTVRNPGWLPLPEDYPDNTALPAYVMLLPEYCKNKIILQGYDKWCEDKRADKENVPANLVAMYEEYLQYVQDQNSHSNEMTNTEWQNFYRTHGNVEKIQEEFIGLLFKLHLYERAFPLVCNELAQAYLCWKPDDVLVQGKNLPDANGQSTVWTLKEDFAIAMQLPRNNILKLHSLCLALHKTNEDVLAEVQTHLPKTKQADCLFSPEEILDLVKLACENKSQEHWALAEKIWERTKANYGC